jgi:cytochrome c-type biogenesis protein CcmH
VSPRVKWGSWALILVALVVALVFGASQGSEHSTPSQRATAIDSELRCPSCEDISVEDSSASTAVAIRALVSERVREGQSTSEILSFLEGRYGEGILLRPPVSGGTAAVWVIPLVVVGTAIAALGAFFWRRRQTTAVTVTEEEHALVRKSIQRTGSLNA